MHRDSRQSIGGACSISYVSYRSAAAADGTNKMPFLPSECLCMSWWEWDGNKKEKKKEKTIKKLSSDTEAISLLSLTHDNSLCYQPCPCSSVLPSGPPKLPVSLALLGRCLVMVAEVKLRLLSPSHQVCPPLCFTVLSSAFWRRQLPVYPNCPSNNSHRSNNSNNSNTDNNAATAK